MWSSELTELENSNIPVTWDHFTEIMISYFGTQVPARETQVKYKACKQITTVADFVRRLKSLVQLLENTALKPSVGDVIDHFIQNLHSEPREWVLQHAPASTWYTTLRDVFMKALQWETNNRFKSVEERVVVGPRLNATQFRRDFRDSRVPKRKFGSAGKVGYHKPNKRVRGDGGEGPSKPKPIPKALYDKRMSDKKCFKCGLAGHRADKCPNGFMDENGNAI